MPITPKQETGMAIIVLALVILILMTCHSCKSSKYAQSKVHATETLVQSNERLSVTHHIDSITKHWILNADSIIISLRYADESARNCPASAHGLQLIAVEDSSGTEADKTASQKKVKGRSCPKSATTAHPPSISSTHPPSEAVIKIYAPHITASSDEKSVASNSSVDSSNMSLQSTVEESQERRTAPFINGYVVAIILVIIISCFIIIIKSLKK